MFSKNDEAGFVESKKRIMTPFLLVLNSVCSFGGSSLVDTKRHVPAFVLLHQRGPIMIFNEIFPIKILLE